MNNNNPFGNIFNPNKNAQNNQQQSNNLFNQPNNPVLTNPFPGKNSDPANIINNAIGNNQIQSSNKNDVFQSNQNSSNLTNFNKSEISANTISNNTSSSNLFPQGKVPFGSGTGSFNIAGNNNLFGNNNININTNSNPNNLQLNSSAPPNSNANNQIGNNPFSSVFKSGASNPTIPINNPDINQNIVPNPSSGIFNVNSNAAVSSANINNAASNTTGNLRNISNNSIFNNSNQNFNNLQQNQNQIQKNEQGGSDKNLPLGKQFSFANTNTNNVTNPQVTETRLNNNTNNEKQNLPNTNQNTTSLFGFFNPQSKQNQNEISTKPNEQQKPINFNQDLSTNNKQTNLFGSFGSNNLTSQNLNNTNKTNNANNNYPNNQNRNDQVNLKNQIFGEGKAYEKDNMKENQANLPVNLPSGLGAKIDDKGKIDLKKDNNLLGTNSNQLGNLNNSSKMNQGNKVEKEQENSKIKPLSKSVDEKKADDFKINAIMNLSIEDMISKWKNELDDQVIRFEKSAEEVKKFELNYLENYEKVEYLSELINKMIDNGENTLLEMENVSKEEDKIIDQLDNLDKNLEKIFDFVNEKDNKTELSYMIDDRILQNVLNLDDSIKENQNEINKIQENFIINAHKNNEKLEKLRNFDIGKHDVLLDKNDLAELLNSYFDSIRAMQLMVSGIDTKLYDINFELNDIKQNFSN